jgi:predicted Zn-dependent peptidase
MVESERGVVLSERRTGLENSHGDFISIRSSNRIPGHPYHWPVMGYEDEKNWTQARFRTLF